MLTSQMKRVLSAIVFLPFFLLILIKGASFHFFLIVLLTSIVGIGEFFSFKKDFISGDLKAFGYLWAALILIAAFLGDYLYINVALAGGVVISLFLVLRRKYDFRLVIDDIGFLFTAVLYVAFLMSHLLFIREMPGGGLFVLFLFVMIWSNDTLAYYTGMTIGKRKLYPEISPGKSIEGFVGGFAGTITASVIFSRLFLSEFRLTDSILIGIIIGIIGPLGDLCESMFKRAYGVKDSGSVIPGHGGILDRVDSLLLSAPVMYFFLIIRGYGG